RLDQVRTVHPREQQRDVAELQRREQRSAVGDGAAGLSPAAVSGSGRSGSGEADAPRSRQPLAERERRSARTRAGDGAPFWGTADAAGEGRQEPESGARCGESVEPDSLSGYRFPGESAAPDAAARPTAERSTGSGIRNLRPTDAP